MQNPFAEGTTKTTAMKKISTDEPMQEHAFLRVMLCVAGLIKVQIANCRLHLRQAGVCADRSCVTINAAIQGPDLRTTMFATEWPAIVANYPGSFFVFFPWQFGKLMLNTGCVVVSIFWNQRKRAHSRRPNLELIKPLQDLVLWMFCPVPSYTVSLKFDHTWPQGIRFLMVIPHEIQ